MQSPLVSLAKIAATTVLICESFFVAPFAHGAAKADQLDDVRLKLAVKGAFSLDPYLWSLPVTLTVDGGRITVSGRVDTPMQKRFVMRKISDIIGPGGIIERVSIRSVEPAGARRGRYGAGVLKDAKVALAVRKRLRNTSDMSVRDLRVTVSKGLVTLAGEVDTSTDKLEAGRLASEVDGVSRIANNLKLRGEHRGDKRPAPPDQSWKGKLYDILTATRARKRLATSSELASCRITVGVRNGIVTLTGEVPDEDKLFLAEQLITELSDVEGVINELRLPR